jgi:flagellar basal body P-ring formation protein FlgA
MYKNNYRLKIAFLICLLVCLWFAAAHGADKTVFDQNKLNQAIKEYVEKNMPWPAGTMQLEIFSNLADIAIPEGKVSWKVDSKRDEGFIGDTYLLLKLYSNGTLLREESIRVRIEVQREFVVSTKFLGKDSVITASDVCLQKKWVRSNPLNSVSNTDEVIGKCISVTVRPNTEIMRNMLKETMVVRRGKLVQIFLDSGAMKITTTGLSEEDGAEGSTIKVRNLTSNKIIYARVIGDARVRIDF